jgi:CheY-like chemotaxis protein
MDLEKLKIRILVVDDEGINLLYLKSFLSKLGLQVESAVNGLQALEKYDLHPYDIILMDGQMPKMDGFEATRIIREKEKVKNIHTPIIAITGYNLANVEEKFIAAGADDFIIKPLDEDRLLCLIEKHVTVNREA